MGPDPTYPLTSLEGVPSLPPGTPAPRRKGVQRSRKGTQIELLAIKVLESEGYTVHRAVRTGVRRGPLWISQSNDVFGCIDLVAKKTGERTRWIQVTADGGVGRKKAALAKVPWDPAHDAVEIWRWVGGASRRHKGTGRVLERQYFQVYHLDDSYALRPERRIPLHTLVWSPPE
ncbi:MAG TPA: hypothetical protein VI796_02810 [Candidatus Thermoplasmatota archaeon]|nr:hypothetical protein [Candidatus Thermoplasmatota archaeon]